MRLEENEKILKIWDYALNKGAEVIIIRHAPKAGDNLSDLSKEAEELAENYGKIISGLDSKFVFSFFRTEKSRTTRTLKLMFPYSSVDEYKYLDDLKSPIVSDFVQEQVNRLHTEIARWRGYNGLNQTYYFLEKLGGKFDKEHLFNEIGERTAKGIKELFKLDSLVIFCGHSPSMEVACEKLLNITLSELGGFFNPLDCIFLSQVKDNGKINFIARCNPIIGYVDLESESYYK